MQKKVLIIENHPDWMKLIKEAFQKRGWSVVGITDRPDVVLRLLAEQRPDLVTFATMNDQGSWPGLGIVNEIRNHNMQVPIIAITGWPDFNYEGRPGVCKHGFDNNLDRTLKELFPTKDGGRAEP